VPKALGKDLFTLGKGFAEPLSAKRRPAKGPLPIAFFRALGKVFAEGHGGSRQTKVAVRSFPPLSAQRIFQIFFT
jgi:hypothetical protein